MEPLPSRVVGQGDEFSELLDRRIKRQDEGESADNDSLGKPSTTSASSHTERGRITNASCGSGVEYAGLWSVVDSGPLSRTERSQLNGQNPSSREAVTKSFRNTPEQNVGEVGAFGGFLSWECHRRDQAMNTTSARGWLDARCSRRDRRTP